MSNFYATALACVLFVLGLGVTANADLTIISSISIQNSKAGVDVINLESGTTTYIKGEQERVDTKHTILICNHGTQTAFVLVPALHLYSALPFKDAKEMLRESLKQAQGGAQNLLTPAFKLKDTGQNIVINGRSCRRYLLPLKIVTGNPKTITDCTVWISSDIPKLSDSPHEQTALHGFLSPYAKHPGLIVLENGATTNKAEGQIDFRISETVSTDTLADTLFTVPDGYTLENSEAATVIPPKSPAPKAAGEKK